MVSAKVLRFGDVVEVSPDVEVALKRTTHDRYVVDLISVGSPDESKTVDIGSGEPLLFCGVQLQFERTESNNFVVFKVL